MHISLPRCGKSGKCKINLTKYMDCGKLRLLAIQS